MNLFFINEKNEIFFRPDTTLDKECPVYYVPDSIKTLEYTPFLYARIDRAGKYIASRFAERYYSEYGNGIAIFGYEEGNRNDMLSNLLDNSSIVSELKPIDKIQETVLTQKFNDAIEKISEKTSFKTGDYVCLCSSTRKPIAIGDTIPLSEKISILIK